MNHRSAATRPIAPIWLLAAIALLLVGASRFWLHDVLPYFVDYTEQSFRRFWQLRHSLMLHIVGGTVALFAGPFQLWAGTRGQLRRVHRLVGYAYIAGIVMSAGSSFYLALYAKPDFGLSLAVLAAVWLLTVGMALIAVRNRRFDAHRLWMMRSYIATFSFVSYRYLVGLSIFAGLGSGRHATVLWISWVVPMMLFETLSHWRDVMPTSRTTARPAPVHTV